MEDYGPIIDKPLQLGTNALNQMALKEAASKWGQFKRFLSTASEPFLRKNMGERYLSAEAIGGGSMIWVIATGVALAVPFVRSPWVLVEYATPFHSLGHLLNHWLLTLIVGYGLIHYHFKFGQESLAVMRKYREEGEHYHTQSRGVDRWDGRPVPLLILGVLFLFNLPAAILFVASCGMSAKIAAEQQAAIYSRYLDSLDARVEQEYLESAILGKCPVEITQLHKPLSTAMNEDLRKNIAAAAVGKKVELVEPKAKRTGGEMPSDQ